MMSLKAIVFPNTLPKRKAANTTTTTTATILNLSKVFAFRALVLLLIEFSGFFIPTTSKSITAHTSKSIRSYIHAKTKQTQTQSQTHDVFFCECGVVYTGETGSSLMIRQKNVSTATSNKIVRIQRLLNMLRCANTK